MSRLSPTRTTVLSRTNRLNPGISTEMLYSSGCRSLEMKRPCSLVVYVLLAFVFALVTTTGALGIAAPEESATVPAIRPASCAVPGSCIARNAQRNVAIPRARMSSISTLLRRIYHKYTETGSTILSTRFRSSLTYLSSPSCGRAEVHLDSGTLRRSGE